MTASSLPLPSLIFALAFSFLRALPLTAAEPSPATSHPKGEVRITGERSAIVCVRIKMPLSEDAEVSFDNLVEWVHKTLLSVDYARGAKAIRFKSTLKAGPHPKVKLEARGEISLLEFLVIISQKAGVNIELTEDEVIFKDGG